MKNTNNMINTKVSKILNIINIALLSMHLLLLILYISFGAAFMTITCSIFILLYIISIKYCTNNAVNYSWFVFIEIWLHMIFAVINFGWDPGFQTWSFALVCAFFLPSLAPDESKNKIKRPIIVGIIFGLTYYILVIILNFMHFKAMHPLPTIYNHILFTVNTLTTFITIFSFTLFYTRRHEYEENLLEKYANYDELTKLYNRYNLNQIGLERIQTFENNNNPFYVALIDIDYFKSINDTYGHISGDMILVELSNILKKHSTNNIICGRWGGEEFLVISDNNITYNEFIKIIEEIRLYVNNHKFKTTKNNIDLTISAGISYSKKSYSLEKIINTADKNLYKAKDKGRNRVIYQKNNH